METPMDMSRGTALRIALAARAMPGISVGQLLGVLQQSVKGPLTEASLQTVTVTDLKIGVTGDEDAEASDDIGLPAMKEAVRILWGESLAEDMPQPVVLESLPESSIRVAIASNNGQSLDGHFGSCLRFLIYQVSAERIDLVDIRSTIEADSADDRNAYRVGLIEDCQVLYVVSVGGPAAARVIKTGIYPIKKASGGQAEEILAELQRVMTNTPPPWLAKLLGVSAEARVRFALSDDEAASA